EEVLQKQKIRLLHTNKLVRSGNMELSKNIARHLLAIEAVQIRQNEDDYFTWTSGIRSPIDCDNRLTMSYPDVRREIVRGFVKKVEELNLKVDVVAGCATAGIPHAAWLAEALNVPMVYVRSKPKGHGQENQIEGTFKQGANVLVIEDSISTGGSALEAANALERAGANIVMIFTIFTYGLDIATENFRAQKFKYETLTSFDTLLELLVEDKQITE